MHFDTPSFCAFPFGFARGRNSRWKCQSGMRYAREDGGGVALHERQKPCFVKFVRQIRSSRSFVTHATFFTHVTFVTFVTFVTLVAHVTFVTSDSFNPFISCDSCSRIDHSLSKNSWFYFFVSLALHYLCLAKIGCGSAKAFKQAWVPALALHYLCFAIL